MRERGEKNKNETRKEAVRRREGKVRSNKIIK